jgi:Protein of unknown function (DUF1186)/SEC-C motif
MIHLCFQEALSKSDKRTIWENAMEPADIIAQLARRNELPVEAIRAASEDRTRMTSIFVEAIEQFVSEGAKCPATDSIFFIFHLLGDWREKSAYRPLARLLRCSPDLIDDILGGAITDTSHRVMAAVFDGDPKPLYEVILDPDADEYIRSRMLEAIAMVTLNGGLPRAEAARFLRACYSEIDPQEECFVWNGWQSAIALLGLTDLKPLVEQAFKRESISRMWLNFQDFEEDLQKGIDDPASLIRGDDNDFTLFGDTIEELSRWSCFNPEPPKFEFNRKPEQSRNIPRLSLPASCEPVSTVPATNPYKNVGRNDPCPCGSGKKFKKCCLTAAA